MARKKGIIVPKFTAEKTSGKRVAIGKLVIPLTQTGDIAATVESLLAEAQSKLPEPGPKLGRGTITLY
jgi:hypothetical protein